MAVGLSLLIWSATDLPLTTSGTTEGATSGTGAAISLPLARRRRLHPRSSSRHHRRGLNESPYAEVGHLFGSVSDDFVAPVSLGGQTFLLVVDTGSAALAVAGGPNLGCRRYLDTADHCDLNTPVECLYGSGGWKGVDCRRDVRIGGLDVPGYELSAITEEEAFLTCPESPADSPTAPAQMLRHDMLIEGIVGLSLRGLGGPTNTSLPLLHALFHAHHRLPRSFGLQCCPYDAESGRGGDGALDIGGADRSHYQGDGFAYAAVVAAEAGFWGVDVQALRVSGSDLPLLRDEPSDGSSGGGGALDRRGRAKYIVDSGTSLLLFRPRTFLSLKHALLASLAPGTGPPPTHGFWNATACVGAGEIDISSLPTIELTLRGDVRGEGEVEVRCLPPPSPPPSSSTITSPAPSTSFTSSSTPCSTTTTSPSPE